MSDPFGSTHPTSLRLVLGSVSSFLLTLPGFDQVAIERRVQRDGRSLWSVVSFEGRLVADATGRMLTEPPRSSCSQEHKDRTRHTFTAAVACARQVRACYPTCGIDPVVLGALDLVAPLLEEPPT